MLRSGLVRAMLAETWWVLLVRGILLVLIGLAVLADPVAGLGGIIAFLAAWWTVSGLAGIIGSLQVRKQHRDWWLMLISAIAGLTLGILTFAYPLWSALVLTLFVGAYAVVHGAAEIWTGIRLRREIEGEGWLVLAGVLAVLAGVLILSQPFVGMVSVTLVVGAYAFAVGILLCVAAFRVRRFGDPTTRATA